MAFSSYTNGSERRSALGASITQLVRRALAKADAALKTLQIARMMTTLSNMSDHQLAQIGISRSDIPKYAETLMAKE